MEEKLQHLGERMKRKTCKLVFISVLVIVLLVFVFRIFIVVDPGERAVIFNKATGNLRVTESEGLYLLWPFIETPIKYDVRMKTYTMSVANFEGEIKGDDSLQALTADGQNVFLDISVRFHPDPGQLISLHKQIGQDYINKIVRPQVRSTARLVVAGFAVIDVYSSKRNEIQDQITKQLKKSFKENFIVMDEVLLRNVKFTSEFQRAIENKQIAQQEAQRMKYVLEKQELEKMRKIIEAEGEAESIKLKGRALTQNPLLIKYEYVKLLSPQIQAVITDQNTILNLSDFLKVKR